MSPADTMNHSKIIEATENFVRTSMSHNEGGHDWWHVHRVRQLALHIGREEHADLFVVETAALLHDISDAKFNGGDENKGVKVAESFLNTLSIEKNSAQHICQIIENISFKGGNTQNHFESTELWVVQDADRLDALGAIGIARAFNYGGFKNRPLYDPAIPPVMNMTPEEYRKNNGPTLNHFYEKLLLLKDRMHTATGKRLATERHRFLEGFILRFKNEWDGIS